MGDAALATGVEHRVVVLELRRDVVGIQYRDLGGAREAGAAHHADVHPGDGQDGGRAPGRGGYRILPVLGPEFSFIT